MEHLIQRTLEQKLMMTTTISGLGSSKNILLWIPRPSYLWDFQLVVTQVHKVCIIALLVEKNTHGRDLVERHADFCIDAGINFEGINQEVASGQWEFQIFAKGAKAAGDQIWVARYLLDRLTEDYGYYIEYHPKPIKGDWNGSGMHANFSNTLLRTCGSKETYEKVCEAFRPVAKEHISVYGEFNDQRLTGAARDSINQ